jgi:hypothetical protein
MLEFLEFFFPSVNATNYEICQLSRVLNFLIKKNLANYEKCSFILAILLQEFGNLGWTNNNNNKTMGTKKNPKKT